MQPSAFQESVWRLTAKIPRGRVTTYALLAEAMGNPQACRAVGNALNKNPYAPQVPCHRVVRSNGELGGFANGAAAKAKILRQEGVGIDKNGRIVNFEKVCYKFRA